MRRTTTLALALASTLALSAPTAAFADEANALVNVSATVTKYASVTASSIAFGNYQGQTVNAASAIAVTAANGTPYVITLSSGASNVATARTMTSGTNTLSYGVYRDSGRTQNWGATGATGVNGTGTGTEQMIAMYATIPGAQTPKIGTYTDTLTATVTY